MQKRAQQMGAILTLMNATGGQGACVSLVLPLSV